MLPAVDPPALLQFVLTAVLIVSGALLLVRRAASTYFVVDASFGAVSGFDEPRPAMSVGGEGGCAVCGRPASKKCSRCKTVRYCSQACQSKHWEADHRFRCKQPKLSDEVEVISSESSSCQRRKVSGFGSISLVPARGTCNILQKSEKILFPYEEFVKLFNWDNPGFTPCGLVNCGNSCFANVVLQCLTCTRPLIAYLLERSHSRECCVRKRDDWCFLCELQIHVQRASESVHPFSPINILSGLRNIGGNLDYDRQEDAHEFMRFAIDRMQLVCLDVFGGERAVDTSTQETTLIQYIFGGRLQSQVTCTKCNMMSNRYENMMDLTVEIQGDVESLEECLDQFTRKEWLDGENKYKCDGCNDYVKAWKHLKVHQAPNILTIALKRFQSGRFGKLNKRVTFPENLDLTPYMSGNGDGSDIYTLYAVVVHLDMLNASFFGHYICYTKDYCGRWYRIDDCEVMNVEVEDVLSEGAYMLLYSRRTARREPFLKCVKPPGTMPLAETDQKASNTPQVANFTGASCQSTELISLPNPGEVSKLQDTGQDKKLWAHVDSAMVKKLDNMVVVDTPIDNMAVSHASVDIKPILLPGDFVDIDDPPSSSPTTNDLEEGNHSLFSSVPEHNLPVDNMQLDTPDISYKEVNSEKCQEPFTSSAAGSHMEKKGSSGTRERHSESMFALDKSLNLQDIVVATTKQAPIASITTSSMEPEPSDDLVPGSVDAGKTCRASSPATRVNSLEDTSSGNEASKTSLCQENGSNGKPKPLFPRGFLDKCGRKKSWDAAEKTHVESHSDALVPKSIRKRPSESMYALHKSLNLQDFVIAATKQAPIASITTLSMGPGPSDDSIPGSEEAGETCRAPDPANRVNSLEDMSFENEGKKASSCQDNGSNGKPKPVFPRGFLDKSGRKKSWDSAEKTQVESCSDDHVSKSNTDRPGESMYALDKSLNLQDIVVATTKQAPIASTTFLSMEAEPSDDSVPGSEDAGESCRAPDPANRVNSFEDTSFRNEGNKASSCQENGCDGKPTPLFPRGFLDKSGRKKSQYTAEKSQVESCSDDLVPKSITERPSESMYALDESLNLQDIVVATTNQAPIACTATLSIEPEPSGDSVPGSEDAGGNCRASDPANRVNSLEDMSFGNEGNKASSSSENGSNGKPKPLFPCGFLDKSGRKKSQDAAEKTQVERHSDSLVPKEKNGFCNGHSDLGLAEQESSFGCGKAISPGELSFISHGFPKSSYMKSLDNNDM